MHGFSCDDPSQLILIIRATYCVSRTKSCRSSAFGIAKCGDNGKFRSEIIAVPTIVLALMSAFHDHDLTMTHFRPVKLFLSLTFHIPEWEGTCMTHPCTYSSYFHSVSKPGYSCATCEVSFYQSRAAPRTAERARIGLASSPHPADSTPHRYTCVHVCMYEMKPTHGMNVHVYMYPSPFYVTVRHSPSVGL